MVKSLVGGCAMVLSMAVLNALPISGEISFDGAYTVDNANLASATQFTSFSNVEVEIGATGDYAGTDGTSVTMTPFVFDPFGAGVIPQWTFTVGLTTYSFDLLDLSIDFRNNATLVLSGTGVGHIDGLDDTAGRWNLTANTSGATFSFSSSTAVPEGGVTLTLLGTACLGLAALRRRSV